ncbi:tyrosine-type recombinase/integrase [Enterococcus gilvus]|uniref:Tyr recombinase domain-containing protein n=1 Tax=Enterococcus gilvus ATCC BAA-350 TaxID=1158614 RepID=R2VD29_9ENTE|nr:tyrosine-type recombinase/integrase [Enterococcus gilvus]EOI55536.1 hypothetical protein UKC_02744 [Enterococcus gilvus ATCC BAA-350]EOW81921.1 hypothetical protein I592_01222 [Enterococcus gilvus ATCC BAA-350]
MDFETLFKEYLLDLKLKNFSKRTIESYNFHKNKFIRFYKREINTEVDILKITSYDYKLFISDMLDSEYKATYINTILKTQRAFWNYLVNEDVVKVSPMAKIKNLKETKVVLTTFNDAEIKRMLNFWKFDGFMNARNKCIIAVLADTGIRVSELLNIKDSDLSSQHIRICGKGDKWRVVPISDELDYFITKYRRIRDNHFKNIRNRNNRERKIAENLFLNKTGSEIKTVANLQIMIKETAIKANVRESVRASPHTFRHYWTVKNLNLGQDIFTISRILGHSKLDTTKIYISSITDEQLITKAKQTSPLADIL